MQKSQESERKVGFFNKKLSLDALKDAVSETASKVSNAVQNVDISSTVASVKASANDAATRVTQTAKSVDVAGSLSRAKDTLTEFGDRTLTATQTTYESAKEKTVLAYEAAAVEVSNFDYSQLKDTKFYQDRFTYYRDLSQEKVSEYFRNTFEVDKPTMQMVDDARGRLPVPAKTVDDIFEQCKKEAIRRAVASFGLAGMMQEIDLQSEAKYNNLSEAYQQFRDRSPEIRTHENYSDMSNERKNAINNHGTFATVEDGYNKAGQLFANDAQVEHVIAKKELFDDFLLRIGTTDQGMVDVINSKENLIFADGTFNGSLQDKNIYNYLADRGRPHETDPDLILVDITNGKTGDVKTVAINKKDVDEAYERADAKRNEHRLNAAMEVGATVVKSGAAMAAQQVVGLIVVETIDIFVDEIRNCATNGKLINSDGWIQNSKDTGTRIQQRLEQRFEERQIWARAKELGIESGVAGALSVIPQILISCVTRMPAFVLAMIRESTLSVVRCVRIMASNDENKLDSIGVILAATASTIVGVYATHVISKAIMAVPLLKTFDRQVSGVLAGLFVTAVPLATIYVFDQNKQKLKFAAAKYTSLSSSTG